MFYASIIPSLVPKKGENVESTVVRIGIAILLVSILLPIGIDLLSSTDTTGWDASVISIWDVFPVFAILGVALLLWKQSRGGAN